MFYLMYAAEHIFLTFTFCNLIKSELSDFMENTMNFIRSEDICDDFIKIGYVTHWEIIRLIVTTYYILLPYYRRLKRIHKPKYISLIYLLYSLIFRVFISSLCEWNVILRQEVGLYKLFHHSIKSGNVLIVETREYINPLGKTKHSYFYCHCSFNGNI